MATKSRVTIVPVVLSGGAGSRLWPMSRAQKPKQFHALIGDKSLLASTLERMPEGPFKDAAFGAPTVIGNVRSLGRMRDACAGVANVRLVLEPAVRDTAAAIAACTAIHAKDNPDAVLAVLPSDARIDDHEGFRRTLAKAARVASATDAVMTIGITPTRPETQYGYIEAGEPTGEGMTVRRFREKPDEDTARAYLASGRHLWNAGMFVFRAGRMAETFATLQPRIWEKARAAVDRAAIDAETVRLDPESFGAAERISFDYAIMERADNIGVVPAEFDWDDLGSWAQLHAHADKDDDGNALRGDVITIQSSGSYVRAQDVVVAVAGVRDLVVVAEDNKVLVTSMDQAHLTKDASTAFKQRFAGDVRHDRSKTAIRRWLFETCLPLWADKGIDRDHGGVHEALVFDGTPAPHEAKRFRVLPRQIYCFAHAGMLGWDLPDGLLENLFDTMTRTGWHPTEGGWIHLFHPDGSVRDDRRDTYDQCFSLLALAWLHRATGWPEARQWADRTLQFMDAVLTDPVHGGYREDSLDTGPRRANPHMHFLEAMLAWHDATGETTFLDRAEAIIDLFQNHFFDAGTGTLREFFAEDWTPLSETPAQRAVEPGHHYEWAWLLLRHLEKRERAGLEQQARILFSTARALGHHGGTGAVANHVQPDGTALSENARCWPQTEALKAAIAFEARGVEAAAALRVQMIDLLFDRYLGQPLDGGWIDAIDARGRPVAADMPSSTLYHVFCALAEHLEKN